MRVHTEKKKTIIRLKSEIVTHHENCIHIDMDWKMIVRTENVKHIDLYRAKKKKTSKK